MPLTITVNKRATLVVALYGDNPYLWVMRVNPDHKAPGAMREYEAESRTIHSQRIAVI